MTLSDILNGAQKLATTGTQVYQTVSGAKLQENAAPQPPAPVPAAPANASTTASPWYKAAWVIPAAIGAAVLLFLAVSRRR